MSRLRTLGIICACSTLTITSVAQAGPFSDIERLGDLMMVMAPTYAFGMAVGKQDWKGAIQFTETLVGTQVAVEGLKMLELERRPNGYDMKSFPSGHSAGAFSGAMFVHKRYGWKAALIPYAMAGITGWTRVHVGAHYWHDVLAGAAISALFTWGLVDKYIPKEVSVSVRPDSVQLGFYTKF